MSHQIAIIRQWKLARFALKVTAHEDCDTDLSFDETGEVRKQLEDGELCSFMVKAAVYLDGNEIANDTLSGCIYRNPSEFMDHVECAAQNKKYAARGEKARCGSYFKDMISTVISEARAHVASMKPIYVRSA